MKIITWIAENNIFAISRNGRIRVTQARSERDRSFLSLTAAIDENTRSKRELSRVLRDLSEMM